MSNENCLTISTETGFLTGTYIYIGRGERGDVLNGEGGFREISRNAMIGRLIAERSFCFSIM